MSQVNYDNLKICQRINRLKLTILNLQTVSNIQVRNGGRCKRPAPNADSFNSFTDNRYPKGGISMK